MKSAIDALYQLLSLSCFDYHDETVCQNQFEECLKDAGIQYHREFKLVNGIIDFYFPKSGLGLEIKASKAWSKMKVYRQCERYLEDARLSGLILATGKSQGMPNSINEKPVKVLNLGVAFL